MELAIREAQLSDLDQYTDLLQRTYQATYVDSSLGLTEECFSKEVFTSANTQEYLKSKLTISKVQKTWLALRDKNLVGAITISDKGSVCELSSFYVDPHFQHQGIGKELFNLALNYSAKKDIVLDTYSHNVRTIEIYKHWGFVVDETKKAFYRHWPEWPAGLQAKCIYMVFRRS